MMHTGHFGAILLSVLCLFRVGRCSGLVEDNEKATLCEFAINALVDQLQLEEQLDIQSDILVSGVCPELVDEEDKRRCERNSRSYWAYLAPSIYQLAVLDNRDAICFAARNACDECGGWVDEAGQQLVKHTQQIIQLVQGDLYCDMENAWWDVAKCQDEILWYMPRAVGVIEAYIRTTFHDVNDSFCQDVVGISCTE